MNRPLSGFGLKKGDWFRIGRCGDFDPWIRIDDLDRNAKACSTFINGTTSIGGADYSIDFLDRDLEDGTLILEVVPC